MADTDTVCEDSNYFVSDVSVENVVSYTWTAVGDGTFQNSDTLSPTYLPGENDLIAGSFKTHVDCPRKRWHLSRGNCN